MRNTKGQFIKGTQAWNQGVSTGLGVGKTGRNFTCQTCDTEFYRSGWQIKRGAQKFCSLGCRRHTDEAKEKISQAKEGHEPWNKGLTKYDDPRIDYERPTTFKDEGKSDVNIKLRKSALARWWRNTVFKRDDYTCQVCKKRGGRLNADHIKRFADFPELRFEISNGVTLCEECHRETPTYGRFGVADGTSYYGQSGLNFS